MHLDERARRDGFSRLPAVGRLLPAPGERRELEALMTADGYTEVKWFRGELCGVRRMLTTTALFVGLD